MNYRQKRRGAFRRVSALLTALVLTVTVLYPGNIQTAKGAASSSATSDTTRISVHDPSIFYDSASNTYYAYGSHLAQAKSGDLRNWSGLGTQGYGNQSLYVSENVEGV